MTYEYPRYFAVKKGENDTLIFDWQAEKTNVLSDEEREEFKKADNSTETRQKLLDVGKSEKHVQTFNLESTVEHTVPVPLTSEQKVEYRKKLDSFERFEKERIELINKRNELEAMIYNRKDFINEDENLKYLKEDEIEVCKTALSETGEWYENEGFNAPIEEVRKRTDVIKEAFKHHDDRVNTKTSVNEFINTFLEDLDKEHKRFLNLLAKKNWIANQYSTFSKLVEEAKEMLNEEKSKHLETPHNEVYF